MAYYFSNAERKELSTQKFISSENILQERRNNEDIIR